MPKIITEFVLLVCECVRCWIDGENTVNKDHLDQNKKLLCSDFKTTKFSFFKNHHKFERKVLLSHRVSNIDILTD